MGTLRSPYRVLRDGHTPKTNVLPLLLKRDPRRRLWYNYGLIPRTPIEGLIANIHALCITETASRLALTLIEHDVLEHHRHFTLTGTPEQIIKFLTVLTEHGI